MSPALVGRFFTRWASRETPSLSFWLIKSKAYLVVSFAQNNHISTRENVNTMYIVWSLVSDHPGVVDAASWTIQTFSLLSIHKFCCVYVVKSFCFYFFWLCVKYHETRDEWVGDYECNLWDEWVGDYECNFGLSKLNRCNKQYSLNDKQKDSHLLNFQESQL